MAWSTDSPPVWVKRGVCSADSLINIALCCLGFLPGLIHAWYIIAKFPDPWDYDYESLAEDAQHRQGAGRPQFVYVVQDQPSNNNNRSYGATGAPKQGRPLQHPTPAEAGASSSSHHDDQGVPPTYAQAVAGDHKTQTQG